VDSRKVHGGTTHNSDIPSSQVAGIDVDIKQLCDSGKLSQSPLPQDYSAVDVSDVWVGGLFRACFVAVLVAVCVWAQPKHKSVYEWLPTINLMALSVHGPFLNLNNWRVA
jgi:hypothetical protein